MNKNSRTKHSKWSLFILLLFIAFPNEDAASQRIPDTAWTTQKLGEGIYWKSYRGNDLFDARLSINLIEMVLDSSNVEFQISFGRDSMMKTSEFAENSNAIAAINGSFFRRDTGGPLVFLKINDEIIFEGNPSRNHYTESGALAWSENQPIQIIKKPSEGWNSLEYSSILSSGPLLIYESEILNFNNDPFYQNRHPRTAVAITNDRRIYLVTIDGRSFQSYGMTIPELTHFLKELGAEFALNLDGGGSTTMWIRDIAENGVVNYPSDNLDFDHLGERDVANVLLLLPSN